MTWILHRVRREEAVITQLRNFLKRVVEIFGIRKGRCRNKIEVIVIEGLRERTLSVTGSSMQTGKEEANEAAGSHPQKSRNNRKGERKV